MILTPARLGTSFVNNPTITHRITVGPSGSNSDYTSLATAILAAIAGGASAVNPWAIIIFPGNYTEPVMTVPAGVIISSESSVCCDTVHIIAQYSNQDLFTVTGGSISGITASGVTDSLKCLFRLITSGSNIVFNNISIKNCSTGIYIGNGALLTLIDFSCNITGTGQGVVTAVEVTGVNTHAILFHGSVIVPASILPSYGAVNPVQTAIKTGDLATLLITGMHFDIAQNDATATSLYLDGGSEGLVVGSFFENSDVAIRIGSVGSNTQYIPQAVSYANNTTNLKIESATGVVLGSWSSDGIKHDCVAGSTRAGFIQHRDTKTSRIIGNATYTYLDTENNVNLTDFFSDTICTGVCAGGVVTAGSGPLKVNISTGDGWIHRTLFDDSFWVTWPDIVDLDLTPSTTNYVFYNSITNTVVASLSPPGDTGILFSTIVTDGSGIRFRHQTKTNVEQFYTRFHTYLHATHGEFLANGLACTVGSSATKIDIDPGSYYEALDLIDFSGATDAVFSYFYGTAGAVEVPSVTTVSTTQYDNSGVLTAMTGGWYRSDTVYITSDERVSIFYGTSQFLVENDAINEPAASAPSFISDSSFPVARLIVKEGVGITTIVDIRPQLSMTGTGFAGITSHAALSGLNADDHLQYMLVTGARPLGGELDIGGNDIVNVATVDGVDVSGHEVRHLPGGADALVVGTPVNVLVGAVADPGIQDEFVRSDHQHGIATGTPETIGVANAEGFSSSVARLDHVHNHGSQTNGTLHAAVIAGGTSGFITGSDKTKLDGIAAGATNSPISLTAPVNVTKAAASAGIATEAAAQDHKHDISTDVPVSINTTNQEGNATSLARSNHVHAHGSQTDGTLHAAVIASSTSGFMTGADKTKLDGVEVGATNTPLATIAPANVTKLAAVIGSSLFAAKEDHKHDISTGTPVAINTTNQEGSSSGLARQDHVHAHGSQTDGTLHAVAVSAGANGFLSGTDKLKLDGIATNATYTPLAIVAPANVTKAAAVIGSSTYAAKEDHKHDISTDVPSTIGTANSEGAATTLARSNHVHDHGAQTSGTLHAAVIAGGTSGFMTGTDKTKLDGLVTRAAMLMWGNSSVQSTTVTRYLSPSFESSAAGTVQIQFRIPYACTLKNMYVRHTTGAGNGNTIVYTLAVNGVASTLTASIASTANDANDLVHTVAVAQGDLLSIIVTKALVVGTSPSDIVVTLEAI
jgi:hypothetical protein